jgi:hypothetical protein
VLPLVLLLVAAAAALGLSSKRAGPGGLPNASPDQGMPSDEWAAVQTALAQETDPEMLDLFAMVLESQGYVKSAALLRQRAITLGG